MADGFLGRWSRRKLDERAGLPLEEPVPVVPAPPPAAVAAPVADPPATEPAPLTLADAQSLTLQSDFSPFIARGVAPDVKNAALKTLFTDPHFNVMDGLDIYIDDYTQPSPLPLSVLRQMVSANALGWVDDGKEEGAKEGFSASKDPAPPPAAVNVNAEAPADVAQSGVCNELPSPLVPAAVTPSGAGLPTSQTTQTLDAHADLRLQPDHAPPAPGAGHGTG